MFLTMFISIVYSFIRVYTMNKALNTIKDLLKTEITQKKLVEDSLFKSIFFNGTEISKKLYTDTGEVISLDSIVNSKVLIYRIFDNSCASCINQEFNVLKEIEKSGFPIMIISTFSNFRLLKSYIKEHGIKSPVYNLKENAYLFSFERETNDIYYCVLDKNLNYNYLFFPIQNDKDLSLAYIQYIINVSK